MVPLVLVPGVNQNLHATFFGLILYAVVHEVKMCHLLKG